MSGYGGCTFSSISNTQPWQMATVKAQKTFIKKIFYFSTTIV